MATWKDKVPNRRGFAPHHTSGKTAVVDADGTHWLEDPNNPGEPIRVGNSGSFGSASESMTKSSNKVDLPEDGSLAIIVDRAAAGEGKPGTKFTGPETQIEAKRPAPMPVRKKKK